MKYLMGIDNGGTFVKAGVVDEAGRLVAVARAAVNNRSPKPGFVERDMDALWQANAAVIRESLQKSGIDPGDIAGVSFSGHGKGLYLVDGAGRPAYPGILSTDTRAVAEVARWKADGTARAIWPKTLQDILVSQPVSLLKWLQIHEPAVLDAAAYVFSVKDFIRYRLTGVANGEYTDFSGANLINLTTGTYDRALLAQLGLEAVYDKLPPLRRSHEVCGLVTEAAAAETGLKAGTKVIAGLFDVDACGIASGMVDEGPICMIAGTWSINEYITRAPVTNGTVALNSMFCVPGYYLVEESSPTSAGNLQWFLDEMMPEMQQRQRAAGGSIFDVVNPQVFSIEPWEQDVYFLPFLHGSPDDPQARGSFVGMTSYHGRPHMLRAVYEGITFTHLAHLRRLLKNRPAPAALRLAGGAANSPDWTQMFADVTGLAVETVDAAEQGILGAAMVAGIGAGLFRDYGEAVEKLVHVTGKYQPRAAYTRVYERKFQVYEALCRSLGPVWPLLAAKGEVHEP